MVLPGRGLEITTFTGNNNTSNPDPTNLDESLGTCEYIVREQIRGSIFSESPCPEGGGAKARIERNLGIEAVADHRGSKLSCQHSLFTIRLSNVWQFALNWK